MYKSRKLTGLLLALFMVTMVLGATPAPAQAAATPGDIIGHWAQSEIQTMLDQGNVSGYPDGSFGPDRTLTRAEFMSMINRTFDFTDPAPISFLDVQPGDWFYNDVAIAVAHKYIAGYEDGSMRPNSPITRQEMAVIVAQLSQLDMTDMQVLLRFTDQASIPFWSRGALAAMVKAGYFNGFPDGALRGEIPTNRGMAAYVLARILHDHGSPLDFEILKVEVSNLNITPNVPGATKYTISEKTNKIPVGDLVISFNKPIRKTSMDDITLRIYNSSGTLLSTDDPAAKTKLYAEFASKGNPDQLVCRMDLDYEALMLGLDFYYPGQTVTRIETDVFAKNGEKLTVVLNLVRTWK